MDQLTHSPTQQSDTKPKKSIPRIIGDVVFYAVILTIIIAGVIGIIGKIKGKNNSIIVFGYSFYVVQTNSMERKNEAYADFLEGHDDQIQVGDLVITKKIPKNYDLQLYDIVTFEREGRTIIHRIVKITDSSNGPLYTTRGDSNNTNDGKRSRDLLTGILVKNAGPKAGKIVSFLQSTWGIAAIAGSFAIIIIATLLLSDDKNKKKKNAEDDKETPTPAIETIDETSPATDDPLTDEQTLVQPEGDAADDTTLTQPDTEADTAE